MVTPNHGHLGNTTSTINISAYQSNAKGGVGHPLVTTREITGSFAEGPEYFFDFGASNLSC
jgi:hypothetical protein